MPTKEMTVVQVPIGDLVQADYNPRSATQKERDELKHSLEKFGFVDPILVNSHPQRKNIIIGGHLRVSVWEAMGNETVPVVYLRLTKKQERELNVRLNKNTGSWDWDKLSEHFDIDELYEFGFEDEDFPGDEDPEEEEEDASPYSRKVQAPVYQVKGEKPELQELFSRTKTDQLLDRIEASDVPEDVKHFMRMAAARHTVFNYAKVAEYYAHAPKEVQALMEDSVLVIIDFEQAIEKGFVQMNDDMRKAWADNPYKGSEGDE